MCYIYELIMRNHLSLILLLLTLRRSKFTYEYIYVYLTITYNKFINSTISPIFVTTISLEFSHEFVHNCTEATVGILFFTQNKFCQEVE